jgi:predicted dehydrogenase
MTNQKDQASNPDANNTPSQSKLNRRTVLKALAGTPVLGLFAYEAVKSLSYTGGKADRSKIVIKELGLDQVSAPKIAASSSGKGDLLRIGFVGFGSRARQLTRGLGFASQSDAEAMKARGTLEDWMKQTDLNVAITGICDVFDLNAENGLNIAANGFQVNGKTAADLPVKRYRTYREMLDDPEIDAVVVATPDHHHARISADAIKAGKHVYCEKSIALTEEELYEVYDAVKSSDRVFQLGHQITQNVIFQQAREIINKNILGKISLIETTTNRNTAEGAWIRHLDNQGKLKPGDERSIDWEQWLGNRPKVPFSVERFYNWTQYFDYDTGMLGQLFTHEYDAINQLLRIGIPKSVVSSGGIYYWKDGRDMPDVLHCVFEYPDRELTMIYSATLASSRSRGRVIMGHDASMELGGSLDVTFDPNSTQFKNQIKQGLIETSGPMIKVTPGSGKIDAITSATEKYYASRGLTDTYVNGRPVDVTHLHIKEWIDCIRNGGTPSDDIEKGFEEGITVLMAHKSYLEKRRVEWDPVNRKII